MAGKEDLRLERTSGPRLAANSFFAAMPAKLLSAPRPRLGVQGRTLLSHRRLPIPSAFARLHADGA